MHQKTGDEKGIHARDRQDERHFERPSVMLRQIRNEDHQRDGAKHGNKNVGAAPDIILEINRMLVSVSGGMFGQR